MMAKVNISQILCIFATFLLMVVGFGEAVLDFGKLNIFKNNGFQVFDRQLLYSLSNSLELLMPNNNENNHHIKPPTARPPPANVQSFEKSLEIFGKRLFSELVRSNLKENMISSPFSIETCIGMARMGAEGDTALEIDRVLNVPAQNPIELANHFHSLLAKYENSTILKMANRIYVMQGYEIQEEFNDLLTNKFLSSAIALDFANSDTAAQTINSWVENKTNNLIKNLIDSDSLNDDTRLVLVNAIHFKGQWVHKFIKSATRAMSFYLDDINTVEVQMMSLRAKLLYGKFPDIDATALELPYVDSDLSMLIILPNSPTGLAALEEKLEYIALSDLTQNMFFTTVRVKLPKFKAEVAVELSKPLKNLGFSRMFSNSAEFGKILKSSEGLQVSKFVHKAVIEVNEEGTEAAAATGLQMQSRMLVRAENFMANKPFKYFIKNANNVVIFNGNVKHF